MLRLEMPLRDAFAAALPAGGLDVMDAAASTYQAQPIPARDRHNFRTRGIFAALGPVHGCPDGLHEQYGTGDTGKQTCGLRATAGHHSCVVLSLGSNNEWAFEEAVHARTSCSIIVADCTCNGTWTQRCSAEAPVGIRDRTRFYPLCVGEPSQGPQFRTYSDLVQLANDGLAPALLKMDIEGAEARASSTAALP
jgi:hypothetical protein